MKRKLFSIILTMRFSISISADTIPSGYDESFVLTSSDESVATVSQDADLTGGSIKVFRWDANLSKPLSLNKQIKIQ